jgi:hypothetical protein
MISVPRIRYLDLSQLVGTVSNSCREWGNSGIKHEGALCEALTCLFAT